MVDQEHASLHAQVHAVVCNWFGGLLAPVSVEDAWLQFGVPAYLTSLFVKNNEPSPNNGTRELIEYTLYSHFIHTRHTPSLLFVHLCTPVIHMYIHPIYTPNTPSKHLIYTPLYTTKYTTTY
jgi:hypothetical protein